MLISKRDYNKWLDSPFDIELNKKMLESFPFLLPRNVWTGEAIEDYDYSFNLFQFIDVGWGKAFGYEMLSDLRSALIAENSLLSYEITQIKEKHGRLCWYDKCATEAVSNVIQKYCDLSEKYCILCGSPKVETYGFYHLCEKCAKKLGKTKNYLKTDELF